MTIHRVLLSRAVVVWLLLRLMVLAMELAMRASGGSPVAGGPSLSLSFAPVPFVLALSGVLSEVDVRRRHESALIDNLGIARAQRMVMAIGVAVAGELALAAVIGLVIT